MTEKENRLGVVPAAQDSDPAAAESREGKYLTFALGQEEYGLEILTVREIIGYLEITAVPQTPDFIEGVVNLRGQVIPVVDLRRKFGMDRAEVTDETCIIVVETEHDGKSSQTGLIVDRVMEVQYIEEENIEASPEFAGAAGTDFILGLAKVGQSVKILLDINCVLGQSGANLNL
ncbi:MAG: purine-binding chemotaxis protein CheW [Sedimentisphaerales bacterium]|nr:purine-binding chemotaxis protein CheW [Sedimentisphaerales bacterium]